VTSIAPGWYKDPADPGTQRYWDGEGWLGEPLPADATPPAGPPPSAPPPAPAAPVLPAAVHIPPSTVEQGPPRPWYPLPARLVRPHGLPQATPGARLVARLVDIAAVVVLNVLVNGWFVYLYLQDFIPYIAEAWRRAVARESTADLAVPERLGGLQWTILLIGLALWFAYEVPALANNGQTPGKRLLGIKVMRLESTDRLGFGRAFRRWYPLAMPTLLWVCAGIGLLIQVVGCSLVLLDRPLRLAMHDRYANTVVVHVGRSTPPRKEPP
jgi:uncharacterized RDD family membrane protein YckC